MKKKNVLVHGTPDSLKEFFTNPFGAKFYNCGGILSEASQKSVITSINKSFTLTGGGGGLNLEVIKPKSLPKFVYNFVDAIVLTDNSSKPQMLQKFARYGVEPKKIILWNNQGIPEIFNAQDNGVNILFMEGLQFHIKNPDDEKFVAQMRWMLHQQKQFYAMSPEQYPAYLAFVYEQYQGKPLDWNNLKTWTEKMQWIKLYDNIPLKTRLADKYLVREWIAEKIGGEYLIPLLGVWDNFDEIDFDSLPDQFVLKCNHGSGMNIIVRDKNNFDKENAREKINAWLAIDYGTLFFEPHYNPIPKKIIAEKFMTDNKNFDLVDYKFWCSNNRLMCCQIESRRNGHIIDYLDLNWQPLNYEREDHPFSENPENISKPKHFELMKKLASELCKDFIYVRVDFYEIENKIYMGEMTFLPGGGSIKFKTEGAGEKLGSLMNLPFEK